ncbi:MAG: ornithine carbamoyltransferase, partial [Planctomycetota bacterium]
MTHFIDIIDHSSDWLHHVLTVSQQLRTRRDEGQTVTALAGRTLAMIFEKPSLRTRVSFEQAMNELGGNAIVLLDA